MDAKAPALANAADPRQRQTRRSVGFDRLRLPDPLDYYTATAGLAFRERHGKWRTTRCEFHGGSDSMRINTETGAFVCMAGCGARGGDVIAYEMACTGCDFVAAAKALGAWIEGGAQPRTRPAPLRAHDALDLIAHECELAAIAVCNAAHGVALSQNDRERLLSAAGRIRIIKEMCS